MEQTSKIWSLPTSELMGLRSFMEPNNVVWGALLGGCKLHRNMTIGQIAVNELMVLEPNNSGYYHLLVNMYAEENRWKEVSKIWTTMKGLGVEKRCPGSSWIEIQSKIHQFAASENAHLACPEVYKLLAIDHSCLYTLCNEIWLKNFLNELEFVLIDSEEKIANLEVSALGVDSKLKLDAMKVMGTHNYYNAAVVGLGIGVDVEAIGSTIEKLRLPLHRMQIVCNDNHGITWVNDSKATNFDATYAGLMGLKGRNLIHQEIMFFYHQDWFY
ncbi:hypothetical protein F8388_010735 [Cannabis sativa]|uniref:Pentatricopeptide repeat-containing protein n=1 Tax=Cannabis sativa TaxID=3483 RepID=A0A7J6G5P1_CANSA|nr:hypothetical protein F8388_010735 [Cannabis sativa]